MRTFTTSVLLLSASLGALGAQQQAPAAAPPSIKQLGLFIYPAKGQAADQQAKDEQACYDWALGQSGIDPTKKVDAEAAGKQAKGQAAEATTGAAVVGAAGGAAAGAAIGAIAGDAGTGAAIGAVAGAVRGRRAKKQMEAQAEAQGEKQASAFNQQQLDTFKKAVSACLEGRGYTVK